MGKGIIAWGHTARHYASTEVPTGAKRSHKLTPLEKQWEELLKAATPDIEVRVDRALRQWNNVLRDILRAETGLRLTVGEDTQAVPVRIVPGVPAPFAAVLEEFHGLEWLILNRPIIEAGAAGSTFVADWISKAGAVLAWAKTPLGAEEKEFRAVSLTMRDLLAALDKANAIKKIAGIEEDVLGAYFFRIPEIRVYWLAIGIVSAAVGVSCEAMTVVVVAHELAHCYSHLGRDIDGERWNVERFAETDVNIVEGLAQFYTQVICARLEHRFPAALAAYKDLLKFQSGPYTKHLSWLDAAETGGEIVRGAMIQCRSTAITDYDTFSSTLEVHRKLVRGRVRKPKPS